MTNFDLIIPQPVAPADIFRFGVVTSASPLRVQLDGDTAPVALTPVALCPVITGGRVLVQIHNRQLIIVGNVTSPAGAAAARPWQTVTGWDSSVELYSSGDPTRVCLTAGGMVCLEGAMRVLSGTSGTIGVLPVWARPARDQNVRCQGSSNNSWGLHIVAATGALIWDRYGPSAPSNGNWLPFHHSWPVAG